MSLKKTVKIDIFGNKIETNKLRDKYIEPPFTVLDTKGKNWQNRKREWIKLGIKSELGRDATTFNMEEWANSNKDLKGRKLPSDTSIFDPVLTELIYRWFCPEKGSILDPFAGGSVRGIVSNYLDFKYTGIELRKEQIESNIEQAKNILNNKNIPNWIIGDSDLQLEKIEDNFDFIFSCPPYMDLEIYSKDINDLSNMNNENFIKKYNSIIKKSCDLLKNNSYACFVVSEIRDKKTGYYKDFVGITKKAFYKAGLYLYNDAILLNSLASAGLRASGNMKNKKLVRVHQNILIFIKP